MKHLVPSSLLLFALACGKTDPAESDATPYPLDVCIVTDKQLGSMGDPVSIVHEGQEIRFCCEPCIAKFEAEPAKYLAKLEAK